jgi:mannosyltransferase
MRRGDALVLAAITLAGLLLRVPALDQGLFGDELFTYYNTEAPSLGSMVERMRTHEASPPLFFAAAWAVAQVGDPTIWIRVPSLLLGTALIPLVGLLGHRIGGRRAGVVAAGAVALSPFAVFFGSEARAYAMLMFLLALSALALLRALDTGRRGWWVLVALASAAALYTHYTAAFPLAAQAAWALWWRRDQARAILLAHGAAAVLFAAWVPFVRENKAFTAVGGAFDLTAGTWLTAIGRTLWGHPLTSLDHVPGTAGLALLAAAGAVAAGAGFAAVRGRRLGGLDGAVVLPVAAAAATPLGLLLYDLAGGGDLYTPRNMGASLPALAICVGCAVAALPRAAGILASVLALGAAGTGTAVLLLDGDVKRPAFSEIAATIDRQARPGDRVITGPVFFVERGSPLHRGFEVELDRPHRVFRLSGARRAGGVTVGTVDAAAWRGLPPGGRVFVTGYENEAFRLPRAPAGSGLRRERTRTYPGLTRLTLTVYVAAAG